MSCLKSSSQPRTNSPVSEQSADSNSEIGAHIYEEDDCNATTKQDGDHEMEIEMNGFIKFNESPDSEAPKTVKRCDLVMPCPVKGCECPKIPWKCFKCNTLMEYGIADNNYYCSCGQFTIDGCQYECDSHKMEAGDASKLKNSLDKLEPSRDVNLLILGETGVGKSTFINAFTNYLTYATLDDAVNGELITLIANKFTITDEEMKIVEVQNGKKTKDEDFTAGQSATQLTKVHRFSYNKTVVRIIDTPGIGDVRGTLQDNRNFQDILDTIASLEELHGIVILLKPNSARLTVTFRYCIEELLSHLHKSAKDNIIFGFTNTRGTNFRPGDTMPALLEHLKKTESDIKCTKENVYCFDSEGYRFLAAHFFGIKFEDDLFDSYRKSWDYSVRETQRMLSYIANLKPHFTNETLSLNTARQTILQLTKPLAEITKNIVQNLENLKREESRIEGLSEDNDNLGKDLMVDKLDLQAKELGHPRTICTNANCVKMTGQEGHFTINYITWCHDHCYLKDVQKETTNNPALIGCTAMNGTHTCQHCGHNYGEHMHITYELIESTVKVENESVKKLIEDNASLKDLKEAAINSLRELIDELREEHILVEKTAAKFGAFLEHNAITPFSDARLEYLHFLIDEEKKKKPEYRDQKLLSGLEDSLRMYIEEVALIKKSIKEGKGAQLLEVPQIGRSIAHLNNLKHSGQMLQQIKNVALKTSDKCFREENHKLNHLNVNTSGISRLLSSLQEGIIGALGEIGSQGSSRKKQPLQALKSIQKNPAKTNGIKTPAKEKNVKFNEQPGKIIQQKAETVDDYIVRCLQSLPPGLNEEDRVQAIIDGLRGEFLAAATDQEFIKVCHLKKYLKESESRKC